MKKAVNNCIAQAMDLAAATVARYNELAQKGVDEDYGKEAYRLRPITQAPFYGYFMGGSLLCTCDGLRINDRSTTRTTRPSAVCMPLATAPAASSAATIRSSLLAWPSAAR